MPENEAAAAYRQADHYGHQRQKSQTWSQTWLWPVLQFLVENSSSGIGSVVGEFRCNMGGHVCHPITWDDNLYSVYCYTALLCG